MTTKHIHPFDIFSVPWLFGLNYLLLFGLTAIDAIFNLGRSSIRARDIFTYFHVVSPTALAYVWLGYCVFLLGYCLPIGKQIAALIHKGFPFISRRSSFVGRRRFFVYLVILFGFTFPIIVLYVQRFGVGGRIVGTEEFDLSFSYLNVVGGISFFIYSLGVWQFMLSRRSGTGKMPRGYTLFVWGCMFALQIIFGIWIGSRTHLVRVLLVAVLAYHYGYRRIGVRFTLVGVLVLMALVMPFMVLQREFLVGVSPAIDSFLDTLAWGWNSIMQHYSSLESFTVIFERLDFAPEPDPLWMLFGGLIPRVLWPDKPFSTWGPRFSLWATGFHSDFFAPTLPGEMLLYFGHIGALIALMLLGILWRTAFTFSIDSKNAPSGSGFIYIALLSQAVPQWEVNFLGSYNAFLRNAIIGLLVFFIVSASRSKVMRTPVAQSQYSDLT